MENVVGVTGARHHLLKGVVFVHPSFIYLFGMSGRQSARVTCVSFFGNLLVTKSDFKIYDDVSNAF